MEGTTASIRAQRVTPSDQLFLKSSTTMVGGSFVLSHFISSFLRDRSMKKVWMGVRRMAVMDETGICYGNNEMIAVSGRLMVECKRGES